MSESSNKMVVLPGSMELEQPSRITNSWSKTSFTLKTSQHLWAIEHFNLRSEKPSEHIKSDTFSAAGLGAMWYLYLYPEGDTLINKDYLSVFLNLRRTHGITVKGKAEISMYLVTDKKILLQKLFF